MRTRFGLVVAGALFVPFLQCSGGDDSTGAQSSVDAGGSDATAPSDSGPIVDAAPVDSGPPIVTVNATLNGRAGDGGPLASRDVVIVDANGVVTKTTSDANGKFGATNVQTPYDIGIPYVPLDAASAAYPHYYAGISRPDPIVIGFDYNTASSIPKPQRMTTLSFTADVCVGCLVSFASPDTSGGQGGNGTAEAFLLDYYWNGDVVHSAPLHFYIASATGAFMSYVDLPSTALVSAGTTTLGTLTFASVANGSIAVTTTVPSGYLLGTTAVRPTTGDGSALSGSNFATATGVANFPKLAGMIVELDTIATLADGSETSAQVTYPEATAPATLAFNLLAPPTPLLPANHATAVDDTQALTWSAFGGPTIYQLIVSSTNGTEYFFHTASTSISLAALTKAGVPLTPGTTFNWQLAADEHFATTDDLTGTRATIIPSTIQGDAVAVTQTFTTQ